MILDPVPKHVAHAGLRALKAICTADSTRPMSDLQSQFLLGVQTHILQTDYAIEELLPISPQELADQVKEPQFRNRMVKAFVLGACIDGEMDPSAVATLEKFARVLQVDMGPVKTAWNLAKKNLMLARIAIVRRSLPGAKIKQTFATQGFFAVIKQFFPLAGIAMPEVTAKYKKLENYSDGTLGKEFINYVQRNGFPFPGEKGAGPEIIVVHDCLHIIGGYGTSASEEIEIAAFQAGCQFDDPIYGLLFGLAQYHLNIQVAPVAPSQALQADPEKMIAAFARGCRVKRDMWTDFDPWDHFATNVDALRSELGLI